MKLSYRGVNYTAEPTSLDMVETDITTTYRGQSYKIAYPRHIPVPQPALNLKYRGVAYTTGVATESAEAIAPVAQAAPAEKPVVTPQAATAWFSPRKRVMDEVANVHRMNLQRRLAHRLEVARERGDQNLVSLLEREMQQI